jgi:hypothetical protein
VCASILAAAMFTGVWSSIQLHRLNGRSPSLSRQGQTVQTRSGKCTGIGISADCEIPPGYILVGLRRSNGDCFAILQAHDATSSSTGLGGGVAEVYGPDGHLLLRFAAIAVSNRGWEVLESRRLSLRQAGRCGAL